MTFTIAQFTFGMGLAGQERVVVDLAKELHDLGHRSLVCTTLFGGELQGELEESHVGFQCLNLRRSYDPRAIIPVVRYLKLNRVDVVITHGSSGCLIPRIAAILVNVPAIIHVEHNISTSKKLHNILIDRCLANFTDKIVCVSESARLSLLQHVRKNNTKVTNIPNGLNTERFLSVAKTATKFTGRRRVGIIARFNEQKGHIYFVEAAAKIVETFQDVEFIFVGDGTLRSMIEQRVNDKGLHSYSHFLGLRNDVGELLQSFDVFVLASLWEGMPITLLEAQYFGVASVVTNVGGNPEVVTDGYNGFLVAPRDSAALASAILKLLINDELRKEFGSHGQRVFALRFGIETMANAYLHLISEQFTYI
ncbi:MAG: glycosyltransferase [Sedimentisphaerales bacterium]